MATFAARKAVDIVDNVRKIVAIELMAAAQGIDFRRPLHSSDVLEAAHARIREAVPHYGEDRYLAPDIETLNALIDSSALHEFLNLPLPSTVN
jgi:histidine ammonia-lyase